MLTTFFTGHLIHYAKYPLNPLNFTPHPHGLHRPIKIQFSLSRGYTYNLPPRPTNFFSRWGYRYGVHLHGSPAVPLATSMFWKAHTNEK